MSGEPLEGPEDLPIAFVHEDFVPLHDPETLAVVGWAEKYARVRVEEEVEDRGVAMIRGDQDVLLPRVTARVASAVSRPGRIGAEEQWVAIDLDEQTLVAYEGDVPVLATLVSSGKEGYEPSLGCFRSARST
jgi:hypothetical protein